ncbi:MAG: FAD:protein FMN transferase, partial [Candidatus Kapabacteria bacterium]|nr:FAD:protein FMN transferase [Candidatus Kapabacteria bacterium]
MSKNLLGTVIEAKVISKNIPAAKKALYFAFKEIERIDSLYSFQNKNSVISRINSMAGISAVKVIQETFELISDAKEFSKKYQGLFDITIGAISELWGFSSDGDIHIPSETEIENLLPTVDYRLIELDKENLTVYLKKKGMKIDPGGNAKGYAVVSAAALLSEEGVNKFLVN